ncbi:hypothetical protein [Pseudoxanthomonas sp. PXM01]|uniref:hypothetical protein n=1 Tax=Pseudoxanthomonas sp. PXM01 TaxID=2769295 RepID=UPI00177E6895|nr:hypothetical protein [Pseudoxanthomonas sp. PXM01]MBD9469509.1 hypothetical protein [Pseudoxanthomonas sp. PXM01]
MADNDKRPKYPMLPVGIGAGVAIGIAIGTAMDNLGAGIAIGLGLGVAFAVSSGAVSRDDDPKGKK